jgi:enamine deaminase RidA (YjgF/YER057c/UK114 family)
MVFQSGPIARLVSLLDALVAPARPRGSAGAVLATAHGRDAPEVTFLNPPGIANLHTFSQVATVCGGTTVYVSGQLAWDEHAKLVAPGDLPAQTEKVFQNLKVALGAAGATFDDVVKYTIYVVNLKPDDRLAISEVRNRYIDTRRPPASTMVGVDALVVPGAMIEVEAIAVVG